MIQGVHGFSDALRYHAVVQGSSSIAHRITLQLGILLQSVPNPYRSSSFICPAKKGLDLFSITGIFRYAHSRSMYCGTRHYCYHVD